MVSMYANKKENLPEAADREASALATKRDSIPLFQIESINFVYSVLGCHSSSSPAACMCSVGCDVRVVCKNLYWLHMHVGMALSFVEVTEQVYAGQFAPKRHHLHCATLYDTCSITLLL